MGAFSAKDEYKKERRFILHDTNKQEQLKEHIYQAFREEVSGI